MICSEKISKRIRGTSQDNPINAGLDPILIMKWCGLPYKNKKMFQGLVVYAENLLQRQIKFGDIESFS